MPLATISHGGRVFQFRTNPNSIRWTYTLNTKIDETYGGRVVQILSCNIDSLVVTAEAGNGGWDYINSVALFMRDMLFDQRSGGEPGTFSYPTRGWEMDVYATNFPFGDSWNAVSREFTMTFKVQEDVNGVITSDTIIGEIERLKVGIAYEHNDFNTPAGFGGSAEWPVYGRDNVNNDPNAQDPAAPNNTPQPNPPASGSNTLPPLPGTSGGGNNGPYFPTP